MEGKTVLIVEDEHDLRKLLAQRLEKESCTVLSAKDGDEGLKMALEEHPDVILLDVMMPHSGLSMLEELRKDEAYGKNARVILLTNLSPDTENIIDSIDKHEPVFFLVKANYTLDQVIGKVKEALQ